jgi:hypothetical protein
MFSDSESNKVVYFGVWAAGARDRSYQKEALRVCAAAVARCVEEDPRTCPETQAALNWLAGNDFSGAAAHFRRAFKLHHPTEREAAVTCALSCLTRQASRQSRPAT